MKLTYRRLLEARPGVDALIALHPAPIAKVAVTIGINARRINQALHEYDEVRRDLFEKRARETEVVALVEFEFTSENMPRELLIHFNDTPHEEMFRKLQASPVFAGEHLAPVPLDSLGLIMDSDLADEVRSTAEHCFTRPIIEHGKYHFYYLLKLSLDDAIPPEEREAFEKEIAELMDREVEVDLRLLTQEDLATCEQARPGFELPVSAAFYADFLFEN